MIQGHGNRKERGHTREEIEKRRTTNRKNRHKKIEI